MKTPTAFLIGANLFASMLATPQVQASIWRVNSTPGYSSYPGTLQQLISNVANDGDTVHVEASAVPYGDIVCDKRLVFIGPGFKLGLPNGNSDLQASQLMASLSSLTLNFNATNSAIYGLRFTGSLSVLLNCAEAIIEGNFFESGALRFNSDLTFSNVMVRNNYFNGTGISRYNVAQSFSSIFITNNVFNSSGINLSGSNAMVTSVIISHNVFNSTAQSNFCNVSGAEIGDNIFNCTNALASISISMNNIHHNIAAGISMLPNTNSNNNGVPESSIFTLTGSDDVRYTLIPLAILNFPASDGTQRGIYGGAVPYHLSGIPPVPTIYFLQANGVALQGDTLQVTIGTRSNN
ncbi:MAG: hypothetical protein IPP83_07680 [Flavobacteriales bacterium]|nr:hypothetical protein [Flavobacteriales bacterium]